MSVKDCTGCSYDLYYAKTPRHWWLAHAVAASQRRPAILLITEGFSGAKQLCEVSRSIENSPFSAIEVIPGKLSGQNHSYVIRKLYKRFEWFYTKSAIDRIIKSFNIVRVVTANLSTLATQYLYHRLKFSNAEFHVLDDGLIQYRREIVKSRSILDNWYTSLILGFKVVYPKQDKILPFYSDGWFFRPEKVHDRLAHLQRHQIQGEMFNHPSILELKEAIFAQFKLDKEAWNSPKVVFVFSNLSYLVTDCPHFEQNKFELKIVDFIKKNKLTEYSIWIKYHPRERESDVFNLKKHFTSCHFVPSAIPFEVLTSALHSGDWVVGELSTVLFDVAINRADIQVWSLDCVTSQKPEYDLFNSAGVKLIEAR